MAMAETRADHSPTPDQKLFQDFVDLVPRFDQELSEITPGQDTFHEAVSEVTAYLSQTPDTIFSLVTRHTTIRPSQIRSIMGAGGNWLSWNNFKMDVVTSITRQELVSQTQDNKSSAPSIP